MSPFIRQRHTLPAALASLAFLALLATVIAAWPLLFPEAPGAETLFGRQSTTQPAAPPALPSSLYGYVDGAEAGAVVAATVDGVVVAETLVVSAEGRAFYALNVPADDPATPAVEGGSPGATVELLLGGRPLGAAPWQPGGNQSLDLRAHAAP